MGQKSEYGFFNVLRRTVSSHFQLIIPLIATIELSPCGRVENKTRAEF